MPGDVVAIASIGVEGPLGSLGRIKLVCEDASRIWRCGRGFLVIVRDTRHDPEHLSARRALKQDTLIAHMRGLGSDLGAAARASDRGGGDSARRVVYGLCHEPFPVEAGRLAVQPK
jgi:hypothetical protein